MKIKQIIKNIIISIIIGIILGSITEFALILNINKKMDIANNIFIKFN